MAWGLGIDGRRIVGWKIEEKQKRRKEEEEERRRKM